jgi:L-alanine-DL-glutamate epimerase-like enolase superfamily enzyme
MQLHVGRAVPNFYRAEHDPLSNDILVAAGYWIKDGHGAFADAPGAGLTINEEAFARDAKVRFAVAT